MVVQYWATPRTCISVFGGASGLHDLLVPNLRRVIGMGVVYTALATGGMILDGGTKAGVMDMIGSSVKNAFTNCLRIVGCSPEGVCAPTTTKHGTSCWSHCGRAAWRAGVVNYPGKTPGENNADLEPNHTHFVLVPSDDWGGETSTMFTLVEVLVRRIPVVAVLANGGQISKHEVVNAVRHGVAIVVIEGSGRLADQVARYVRHRDANPEWSPDTLAGDDPMLAEVLRDGRLHLFNVTESWQGMQELLTKLLAHERHKLVRQPLALTWQGTNA